MWACRDPGAARPNHAVALATVCYVYTTRTRNVGTLYSCSDQTKTPGASRLASYSTRETYPSLTPTEASVKKTVKKPVSGRKPNSGWRQTYTFLKTPKIEPSRDSVYGCVYWAIRKLKTGTVADITTAAMKEGLHKQTKQDPRVQVQVKLRRLVKLDAVKKENVKAAQKAATALSKAKPVKKVVAKKAATKKSPVKKAAKPAIADAELEELDSSIDDGDETDA